MARSIQLRGINTKLAKLFSRKLELVKGEGYFYFVYDDPSANIYQTYSVMVFSLNQLRQDQWISSAIDFMKTLGINPNVQQ